MACSQGSECANVPRGTFPKQEEVEIVTLRADESNKRALDKAATTVAEPADAHPRRRGHMMLGEGIKWIARTYQRKSFLPAETYDFNN